MFEKDAPMLYYIRDLVSTDQEAVNIANKLGQNGKEYSLASTDDLSYTGAVSNVTINVSIDDLSQVAGKNILIKNGSKIVKVLPITAAAMKVSLPIGIYEIEAPDANSYYGYLKEKNYDCLLAKEGSVSKEIKYEKQSSFSPLSDILETRLYGAKNYPFAVLSYSSSDEEFTLTTMEGMEEKHIDFHTVLPEGPDVWICADMVRVQEIFLNLLSNAARYTPDGGTVSFRVSSSLPDDAHIQYHGLSPSYAFFSIMVL